MSERLSPDEVRPLPGERVQAVDAVRGFVLFSFCMAKAFVPVLMAQPSTPVRDWLLTQLTHSEWHGCTAYDLGFPGFVGLIAMSMSLSIHRKRERGGQTGRMLRQLVLRSLLLFVLGTIFHGGFSVPLEDIRLTRVLHRLAVAILLSGLFELFLNTKAKGSLLIAILLGYWALMEFVPVPNFGAGDDSPVGNLNRYVDQTLLGAETYFILSTLGVAGTCLLGGLGGAVLLSRLTPQQRALCFLGAGLLGINLSLAWDLVCPINRHFWSPSFVLYTSGWTWVVTGAFLLLCDVWRLTGEFFPLTVLGRNSLLTYGAFELLPFDRYASLLAGEGIVPLVGNAQPVIHASMQVLLIWLFVNALDRKQMSLRV